MLKLDCKSNLLFATGKHGVVQKTPILCSCVSAKSSNGNSFGFKLQQHTACDGNLDETFTNQEPLILPHASLSLFLVHKSVCLCVRECVAVPDLTALQTSTDVSGGEL